MVETRRGARTLWLYMTKKSSGGGGGVLVCRCEKTNLSVFAEGNCEGSETEGGDVRPVWSEGETGRRAWKISSRLEAVKVLVTRSKLCLCVCL